MNCNLYKLALIRLSYIIDNLTTHAKRAKIVIIAVEHEKVFL
jgi:hypothetical protein